MKITPQPIIELKNSAQSADTKEAAQLKKACRDFEGLLIKQMLTTMRKSIPKSGLFNEGFAHDMYESMADEELSTSLAETRGLGFGDALYRQLSKQINE